MLDDSSVSPLPHITILLKSYSNSVFRVTVFAKVANTSFKSNISKSLAAVDASEKVIFLVVPFFDSKIIIKFDIVT